MINQSFYVSYPVRGVTQWTDMTCWSAAAAMVLGNQMCLAPNVAGVRIEVGGLDANTESMSGLNSIRAFASALGLQVYPPQSWDVEAMLDMLTNYGPLMMGGFMPTRHFVVVGALWGDGTPDGTTIKFYDPAPGWPTPYEYTYKKWHDDYPDSSEWLLHRWSSAYPRDPVPTGK